MITACLQRGGRAPGEDNALGGGVDSGKPPGDGLHCLLGTKRGCCRDKERDEKREMQSLSMRVCVPGFEQTKKILERLQRHEFGIASLVSHELGMVSLLDDAPVVKDNNGVGIGNSGEAMGDDDGRAPTQDLAEGGLEETFGLGIKSGRCLVEDEEVGVEEEGASDADALSLATREQATAFAEVSVVTFG